MESGWGVFTYLRSSVDERFGGGRGRQFLGSYEERGGKESGNAQRVEFVHESAGTTKPQKVAKGQQSDWALDDRV